MLAEHYGPSASQRLAESIANLGTMGRRAWLGLLGIAVGCAAVVALLNVGHSAALQSRQLFQGMGSELLIATLQLASIELDAAQARQRELAALRNQREVRAPFSGLLVPRPSEDRRLALQVGQLASQGTPLFVLVDLSQLQVRAALEQSDLHKVHEGMFVQVSGEGFAGHTLNGRVVAVGQQARTEEGQGAWFDLLIALDTQPDPVALGVRLGMSAQVTVSLRRNEKGVAVPAAALRTDDAGGHFVLYRADDYHPGRKIIVTPVGAVPQGVEVKGLEAGSVWVQ